MKDITCNPFVKEGNIQSVAFPNMYGRMLPYLSFFNIHYVDFVLFQQAYVCAKRDDRIESHAYSEHQSDSGERGTRPMTSRAMKTL